MTHASYFHFGCPLKCTVWSLHACLHKHLVWSPIRADFLIRHAWPISSLEIAFHCVVHLRLNVLVSLLQVFLYISIFSIIILVNMIFMCTIFSPFTFWSVSKVLLQQTRFSWYIVFGWFWWDRTWWHSLIAEGNSSCFWFPQERV